MRRPQHSSIGYDTLHECKLANLAMSLYNYFSLITLEQPPNNEYKLYC